MRRVGVVALATLGLVAAALPLATAPAGAAVGDFTFYAGPEVATPQGITTGPDGNLWFTNEADGNNDDGDDWITRLDPDTGVMTTFADPLENLANPDPIVTGPDGNLWFGTEGGANSRLGRIDPDTGAIVTFASGTFIHPRGITVGPDGNVWFSSQAFAGALDFPVGRVDPDDGTITLLPVDGVDLDHGTGITVGPDGNIWFGVRFENFLARVDPDDPSGVVTPVANGGLGAVDVTLGPDGNLWFIIGNTIGRIDADDGTVTAFDDPEVGNLFRMTVAPDGAFWMTSLDNQIVRFDPDDNDFTVFTDPALDGPYEITVGPDCQVWFTNRGSHRVGRIDIGVPPCQVATALEADPAVLRLSLPGLRLSVVNASATLTRASDATPLAGKTIAFRAGSQTLCTAVTDANGFAKCPPVGVAGILGTLLAGGYDATFAGSPKYSGSSAHGPLVGS